MRLTRTTLVSFLLGALVTGVLGVTATATAAVVDSRQAPAVVKACATKSGALRLMTGKKCRKRERRVTWAKQGRPGPPGARGADGVSGYQIVTDSTDVGGTTSYFGGKVLACPPGKQVVAGGVTTLTATGTEIGTGAFLVRTSIPATDGTSWSFVVEITDNAGGTIDAIAYRVVCVAAR